MVIPSCSNSSIKGEIGNMMQDFKSEMLQTLSLNMDTMHIKRKQEEAERALAIFCPRCTRRHPRNKCPLNSIEICSVCEENHSIDRRVLLENQYLPPPREVEEEREESVLKVNPPPFLERLTQLLQRTPEEIELLGELKNLCVKIPLLQAIKDVSIYNKLIKEKCFKHPGRRRRDAPTINVIRQLFDLMLGHVIYPKYLDPGSHVVDVHINGTIVPHTLIDLGAAINVMTKDTMLKLNLQGSLRKTITVLQLAYCSTVTTKGIVEDVIVSIDSWGYPTNFLVLQPKAKLNVYPLILGRP
eukprot:PITA_33163